MHSRYAKALAALAVTGAIAVPAVAQANGGTDDPANHEQRQHQVRNHVRHDRVDNDRRDVRHDRVDNNRPELRPDRVDNDRGEHRADRVDDHRRDGRGSDDGPNHS